VQPSSHYNESRMWQLVWCSTSACVTMWHLLWSNSTGRVKYKLCLLMHLIHTGWAPQYLANSVQSVTSGSWRCLRSTETARYITRNTRTKFGQHGFSYTGLMLKALAAWNFLPPHLQSTTETSAFKRHLKHFLFIDLFS